MRNLSNTVFILVCTINNVMAEITTDGTTGIQANIAASNNEYNITENLGTKTGTNLFHSFETFNIEANNTATFSGSSDITNIITRVTGSGASTINGTIHSSIEGANYWLLNPNGVIVGEGASFDISGSINITTADYLSFESGEKFSTDTAEISQNMTISSPAAFGFLSDNSSSIIFDHSSLSLQDNKLVLVSRSVTFSGAEIGLINSELNIIASNAQTTIDISQLDTMEFNSDDYGDVNLIDSAITLDGDATAPVVIRARKLDMVNSSISNLKSDLINTDTVIDADVTAMTQSTMQSLSLNVVNPITPFEIDQPVDIEIAKEPTFNDSSAGVDAEWVNIEVSENKMPESERKMLNLAHSPCQGVTGNSTFAVKTQTSTLFDPMSFNPGSQYLRLDVTSKSNTNSIQLFTDCSA